MDVFSRNSNIFKSDASHSPNATFSTFGVKFSPLTPQSTRNELYSLGKQAPLPINLFSPNFYAMRLKKSQKSRRKPHRHGFFIVDFFLRSPLGLIRYLRFRLRINDCKINCNEADCIKTNQRFYSEGKEKEREKGLRRKPETFLYCIWVMFQIVRVIRQLPLNGFDTVE